MAGRSWSAAALVAVALLAVAASGAARAEVCRVETSYGTYEYDCGGPEAAEADTPWWADDRTQALLAFAGIVGSGGAAGYTYYRLRERRRTLADFIRAVERTYAEHKTAPSEGRPKLVALREEIRARHARGRLEDAQFLELDKRVTGYVARLRMLDLTARFPGLPPAFVSDLRTRVEDGAVSPGDVVALSQHPSLWRMHEGTRRDLLQLIGEWAAEDGGAASAAAGEAVAPAA